MIRKPNAQLKTIVLEETNGGRDIVRYLKSVFMEVEEAPRLFGLIHDDYARTHKIAAARILARLGLEEGKRYLRRNYVQTPFKRVHPEDEDGLKKDMAASAADLYRLVKRETNDGRDIMIYFVGIMKGYHKGYKPHLRLAAAKELVRQIEFQYDEQPASAPSEPVPAVPHTATGNEAPVAAPAHDEPEIPMHPELVNTAAVSPVNPVYTESPVAPDSENPTTADAGPANPTSPDSGNTLDNRPNPSLTSTANTPT